jgi:hypothetical protein
MKKSILLALAATAVSAFAGTAMVAPSGKSKGVNPPPIVPSNCPNYLTYNEVQLSYVHLDASGDGKADGADLRVNYNLASGLFAYGDLSSVSGDFDNTSLDVGLGGYIPLCKAFHVIGRAGYSYFDAEDNSNGWHAAIGARTQIGCNLELNAKAQYGDLVDFDNGTYWSYGVGATWHFNESFALLTEYVFGEDDAWSLRAGIAFKF